MQTSLILYAPVIHAGHFQLFERHQGHIQRLGLVGQSLVAALLPDYHEIRALPADVIAQMLAPLNLFQTIDVLETTITDWCQQAAPPIEVAMDDVTRKLVDSYLPDVSIRPVTAFLRHDASTVSTSMPVTFDRVSTDPVDVAFIERAIAIAERSSDWWRHVGTVIVRDGIVLIEGYNEHMPTEHSQYILGDPRDFVQPGTAPEINGAIHGERSVIAVAARQGLVLDGADVYMSVFPCPSCAKDLVTAGIKRCFFASGNAWLRTDDLFRARGVEMIYVPLNTPRS